MHTIEITSNLLLEYLRTSGKFIRLPNRIETFSPELECSTSDTVFWARFRRNQDTKSHVFARKTNLSRADIALHVYIVISTELAIILFCVSFIKIRSGVLELKKSKFSLSENPI